MLVNLPETSSRRLHRQARDVCGWLLSGIVVVLASAPHAWSEETPADSALRIGQGNPAIGKQLSDSERCQECHGANGVSGDLRIPHHAGQWAGYLVKQLQDFQSGRRSHEVMNTMAADLSERDMVDIAAYFASQPAVSWQGSGNPRGQSLYGAGDWARNLAPCAQCHGEQGQGRFVDNVFYPRLAGQRRVYLRTQLVNWRLGERHNSPDGVMNEIAKRLREDEIDALVDYLSGS